MRPDASFDYAPTWLQDGIATAFQNGAARLAIAGANPALLAGQDPAKVARANVAMSKASKPAMELITRHEINWTIVACATPEWAKLVFPDEPENIAVAKLWEAIFVASRITVDDPVAEWQQHGARLKQRVDMLNAKRFSALHFKSADGSTDLTVGLGGRPSVGGWRDDCGQRRLLPAEHSDRGVLHDAAQGPRGWHGAGVEAAVAPGDADREYSGAV